MVSGRRQRLFNKYFHRDCPTNGRPRIECNDDNTVIEISIDDIDRRWRRKNKFGDNDSRCSSDWDTQTGMMHEESSIGAPDISAISLCSSTTDDQSSPRDNVSQLFEENNTTNNTNNNNTSTSSNSWYDEESFGGIIGTMFANQSLKTVVVNRKLYSDRSEEEMQWFFAALRSLPELEVLVLCNLKTEHHVYMAEMLRFHPTLTQVELHLTSGTLSDELLQAFATVPKLISVKLEVYESFPVGTIVRDCKKLKSLSIISENFEFKQDHIMTLIDELEENITLETLELEQRLSSIAVRGFACAMRKNVSLEVLQLAFCIDKGKRAKNKDAAERIESIKEFMKALTVNCTLKSFWNYKWFDLNVSEEMNEFVLQQLLQNHSLERFHIFVEDPIFWQKKENLLKLNRRKETTAGLLMFQCMDSPFC